MAGPVVFTATWLLLGLGHDGYSHVGGSISVLAAYGAPGAWAMILGFLLQAAAMGAAGWLLRRTSGVVAALLAVNAVASRRPTGHVEQGARPDEPGLSLVGLLRGTG